MKKPTETELRDAYAYAAQWGARQPGAGPWVEADVPPRMLPMFRKAVDWLFTPAHQRPKVKR